MQHYLALKILLLTYLFSEAAFALRPTAIPLERGFAPIPHHRQDSARLKDSDRPQVIATFCSRLEQQFQQFGWKSNPCGSIKWQAKTLSKKGNPLIYSAFGRGKNISLFLGGVHPDELTPVEISFRLAHYLDTKRHEFTQKGIRVVIAPLVNPDGFFLKRPARTNGLVDLNRNFYTLDWYDRALKIWRDRQSSRARYFPGYFPATEVETYFQTDLIRTLAPAKVFSIHAPLDF